jgi:spore maturation protein SpmA
MISARWVGVLKMFEKTGLLQPFSKVNQPLYGMK